MIKEANNIDFVTSGRQPTEQDFARISEWIHKKKQALSRPKRLPSKQNIVKTKLIKPNNKKNAREQIMHSALASFRIEGINISKEKALATLKKVEHSLKR